jgi:hypothetical protein
MERFADSSQLSPPLLLIIVKPDLCHVLGHFPILSEVLHLPIIDLISELTSP